MNNTFLATLKDLGPFTTIYWQTYFSFLFTRKLYSHGDWNGMIINSE